MNSKMLKSLFAAALLMAYSFVTAEDIDLFVSPPLTPGDAPNVLIILDNTGNWNDAFENEKAALVRTFESLPLDGVNVGLMMYGAPEVGYVRAAIRPMNSDNLPKYTKMIDKLDRVDDRASARTLARTMSEAYRYLNGMETTAASVTLSNDLRDYAGNTNDDNKVTDESRAVWALEGNALSSSTATKYISPIDSASCDGRTFIIYIGNTTSGGNVTKDNSNRNRAAGDELYAAGGDRTQIQLSESSHQDNYADEWARFLHQSMGVVTYTLDVDPGTGGNGPGNSALLRSMAEISGGKYFPVSSGSDDENEETAGSEISDALLTIFSEIQSVNSVFASVSLPVSVNTQGTYLNQVYVGMFRPDPQTLPRWAGNLKQYRLAQVNNELKLVDAFQPPEGSDAYRQAVNTSTGFITECARSFWTPESVDSYWSFMTPGFEQTCMAVAGSANSNYPDGNMVEKGAQGYVLRDSTTRNLKTCSPNFGSCTTLTDFNVDNNAINKGLLGASNDEERSELINWARGFDVDSERSEDANKMRPSAHGDIVHSRPVAINFGTPGQPKVAVFYGGNDGILRAINGNRSESIDAVPAGGELWSFMPPEFYGNLRRLRHNDGSEDGKYIDFPGSAVTHRARKDYGMDGAVTAYWSDANNSGDLTGPDDKAWIYATMRRGGRAFYAFDVKDLHNPTLKWKKGCPNLDNDTGCTDGFSGIGQTWSAPQNLKAAGYDSPLLIMGGGYDPCEDKEIVETEVEIDLETDTEIVTVTKAANHSCTANPKGSEIYVLNADTGELLNTLNTTRSVIGDISIVRDSNGRATYAYAADTGGYVYRITIGVNEPEDWTITTIASLGCGTTAGCNANRKFLFSPDVVVDTSTGTHYLMLGSGDREKPLASYEITYNVQNYFFMIKDKPADEEWLSNESSNCSDEPTICLNSLVMIDDENDPDLSEVNAKKGWALRMAPHEQVVTSAITVFGVVTFSTHQPEPPVPPEGHCPSLGNSHVYNIDYRDAASANGTGLRSESLVGGGLPPSPVAGMVTLDDGSTVPFIIGASPNSPLEGSTPPTPGSAGQPKARVFWNVEQP
ncbi:pilus assembly protein [Marinimicrobium sp. ABcell2]|uniref:pilus assembly protein n=1 Tax=Marinimicrobium sp. ABcell2 TaxID=3069751 RepID=UPI0027B2EA8A|nr:hypothetical protein [Marinimicrobium sp. ABcell2]MDQ2075645.1 hypothetical protein [Marinimicrobium sp. ABcell2]